MPISKRLRFLVLLSFLSLISAYGDELNTQLKPELPEDRDEAPAVFKDMGVIQNKAIVKSNDILIAPKFSMDFSDGPLMTFSKSIWRLLLISIRLIEIL
jgi:hypothetical protein